MRGEDRGERAERGRRGVRQRRILVPVRRRVVFDIARRRGERVARLREAHGGEREERRDGGTRARLPEEFDEKFERRVQRRARRRAVVFILGEYPGVRRGVSNSPADAREDGAETVLADSLERGGGGPGRGDDGDGGAKRGDASIESNAALVLAERRVGVEARVGERLDDDSPRHFGRAREDVRGEGVRSVGVHGGRGDVGGFPRELFERDGDGAERG